MNAGGKVGGLVSRDLSCSRPRLLPALLLALCLPAHANWHLDGESSRLSFITGKNGDTAEVHRFLVLHGTVDRKGMAGLRIEMDSVSSGIPLRDEQMRDNLFEVERFAEATVKAQIDLQPINDLADGAQIELRLPLTVTLHGQSHSYSVLLLATRLDARRFQVVTLEPWCCAPKISACWGWKACASSPG
jgi:hypothetical protein